MKEILKNEIFVRQCIYQIKQIEPDEFRFKKSQNRQRSFISHFEYHMQKFCVIFFDLPFFKTVLYFASIRL